MENFSLQNAWRYPNVQRLAVHLPDCQMITFSERADLHSIINQETTHKTTLTAWFEENANNPNAQNYKYINFSTYYTWNKTHRKWNYRKNPTGTIG